MRSRPIISPHVKFYARSHQAALEYCMDLAIGCSKLVEACEE